MNNLRFVVDTNVLVSVVLSPKSTGRDAVKKAEQLGGLLFSEATTSELFSVLSRSKFDRYVSLDRRLAFAHLLIARSQLVEVVSDFNVCRDVGDDMFLRLAVDGNAACI